MNKVQTITQEFVDQAKQMAKEVDNSKSIIADRITYILKVLYNTFGMRLKYWYFEGAEEEDIGNLWRYLKNDYIDHLVVCVHEANDAEIAIIDKYGNEWEFDCCLPTRWLFEDFERELIDGAKKYEELNSEDRKLANIAKSKLTKEELEALRKVL